MNDSGSGSSEGTAHSSLLLSRFLAFEAISPPRDSF
jgi:hypothetical protein